MELRTRISNSESLDRLLDTFDDFTSLASELGSHKVERLPSWMRLTPYFLASAEADYGFFQISGRTEFSITQHESRHDSSSLGMSNKLQFRTGNTIFEHRINGILSSKPPRQPFYQEELCMYSEEENPHASLYVGNLFFVAGHDVSNDINRVGSVVYLGEENFFKRFLKKHDFHVDKSRYSIKPSQYELTITPRFKINETNFTNTVRDVITITHMVLRVLEKSYSKDVDYLKIPK